MTKKEERRRKRLEEELLQAPALDPGKGDNEWWAWWSWDWMEEEKNNWDSLVLELHGENQGNCGEIAKYFVRRFIEFAGTAVPIIDQIEGDTTA